MLKQTLYRQTNISDLYGGFDQVLELIIEQTAMTCRQELCHATVAFTRQCRCFSTYGGS